MAYIYGDQRWWERAYSYFRSDESLENRTRALVAFLPRWKGFLVNEPGVRMTATGAIVELDNVVNCFTNVWVMEGDRHIRNMKPYGFDVKLVRRLFVSKGDRTLDKVCLFSSEVTYNRVVFGLITWFASPGKSSRQFVLCIYVIYVCIIYN